jgi:hypothetical protein
MAEASEGLRPKDSSPGLRILFAAFLSALSLCPHFLINYFLILGQPHCISSDSLGVSEYFNVNDFIQEQIKKLQLNSA